ncbi:hypothetical protein DOM22_07300 [Bdellovibrio sp. ZAP7]|nr:hypothetical protein DOM22_07300 [Bdellovibrio sp. ZAP7]
MTLKDDKGSRLVSEKEVHSVYANGYSAFESTDNQFYLLVHQGTGSSKMVLMNEAGEKQTFSLSCNSL